MSKNIDQNTSLQTRHDTGNEINEHNIIYIYTMYSYNLYKIFTERTRTCSPQC